MVQSAYTYYTKTKYINIVHYYANHSKSFHDRHVIYIYIYCVCVCVLVYATL